MFDHGFSLFVMVVHCIYKEMDIKEMDIDIIDGYPSMIFIDGYPSMIINGYPSMNINGSSG